MVDTFSRIILLLFIYAVIGWLWETFYCSFKAKRFVYRGFLLGPYCPIYGFGIVGVIYLVEPYQDNLLKLFVLAILVVTALEYVTSYVLEKLFHTTWWDYHDVPLNLHGRVALPVSVFWGLCCIVVVKVVHPEILKLVGSLMAEFGNILPFLIVMVISADLIYTVSNLISFSKTIEAWSAVLAQGKQELSEKKEALENEFISHKEQLSAESRSRLTSLAEKYRNSARLPKLKLDHRRILMNFEQLKIKNIENIADIKAVIKELQQRK